MTANKSADDYLAGMFLCRVKIMESQAPRVRIFKTRAEDRLVLVALKAWWTAKMLDIIAQAWYGGIKIIQYTPDMGLVESWRELRRAREESKFYGQDPRFVLKFAPTSAAA